MQQKLTFNRYMSLEFPRTPPHWQEHETKLRVQAYFTLQKSPIRIQQQSTLFNFQFGLARRQCTAHTYSPNEMYSFHSFVRESTARVWGLWIETVKNLHALGGICPIIIYKQRNFFSISKITSSMKQLSQGITQWIPWYSSQLPMQAADRCIFNHFRN